MSEPETRWRISAKAESVIAAKGISQHLTNRHRKASASNDAWRKWRAISGWRNGRSVA